MLDLIVVGGGINGAGIARDAAMRGLKVCLLEADDWCSGTSSRSSMLAHGGLRYLEQFELGLVHEALQDRELMLQQAPHLVRPLRFIYPIYPDVASRRTVRVGLWLYDVLSHGKSVGKRRFLAADDVLAAMPGLAPEDLKGGATYWDGQFGSVERFVLELVLDAQAHGADCRSQTPVATLGAGGVVLASGERIDARTVIDATGPWVDDHAPDGPLLRRTKGAHLAVKRFTQDALIVRAQDGRTFFVLPWHDYTLIGTTDTDFEGDARDAVASPEDQSYLLESARRYFPDADLTVLWTYAGIRPLVRETGLRASSVTRRHKLHDHGGGYWSVQGGKLTTYRHLAEQAVTKVCKHLDHPAKKARPTREGTLPGGPLIPWQDFRSRSIKTALDEWKIPEKVAAHLVDSYGARWRRVAEAGTDRIDKRHPDVWGQVVVAVEEEHATTVEDVMMRRTRLGFWPHGNPHVARRVAARMAELLGWDEAETSRQMDDYEDACTKWAVP